jgi:hypothetical protein
MCVEQQVTMFLHVVGQNVRNRLFGTNFSRFDETISQYFNKLLHVLLSYEMTSLDHHHQKQL